MNMKLVWAIGLALVLIFIYNYVQISKFHVNKQTFQSKKLSQDLRITQISDFHSNNLIDSSKLLDKIRNFNPHIIVLTGDIIDNKTEDIGLALDFVKKIYDINSNIVFVIGNHELRNAQGDKFVSKLIEVGVTVLDDDNTVLEINDDKINVLGLSFFVDEAGYEQTIKEIDTKNFTILLSHSPSRSISYMSGIEDIILSGHTHGGQVRVPFIGAIVSPGQGFFPEYDKGTFYIDNTILYIDSGLGNSVLPIRFLNRVQISNITIDN